MFLILIMNIGLMSDKETSTCWACNEVVAKAAVICPNCDMPLKDSNEEIEDIDSFLDDLDKKSSKIDKSEMESPDIPEFHDEMPDIPDFDSEPAIPEFSEDLPKIPDFATETLDEEKISIEINTQVNHIMDAEHIKEVSEEKEP
ncbi:MAG: hypothetical protein HeimC2_15820, partial [Candidatus Heimdallarchaeota archaeon LC_2]